MPSVLQHLQLPRLIIHSSIHQVVSASMVMVGGCNITNSTLDMFKTSCKLDYRLRWNGVAKRRGEERKKKEWKDGRGRGK